MSEEASHTNKEVAHLRRTNLVQKKAIAQQKATIEKYSSRLKVSDNKLHTRIQQLQEENQSLFEEKDQLRGELQRLQDDMAQKDKYVSEADLAMTIKQRVAAEKAKWEAQHKRELDELRRELKKKQGQERKPVAVVEEHSDEDSDEDMSGLSPAERAAMLAMRSIQREEVKSSSPQEEEQYTPAFASEDEEEDAVAQVAGADQEDTQPAFQDESDEADEEAGETVGEEVVHQEASNGHVKPTRVERDDGLVIRNAGPLLINLQRDLKAIKECFAQTKHQVMVLKAGVKKMEAIKDATVNAVAADQVEKKDMQQKLQHVMQFMKKF